MPTLICFKTSVKLAIDALTRGYEFLVDNALGVGRNYQQGLDITANLMCFFRLR